MYIVIQNKFAKIQRICKLSLFLQCSILFNLFKNSCINYYFYYYFRFNRLKSIFEDAKFVSEISNLLPYLPVIGN